MKVKSTPLKNCYIIEPTVFEDDRGYFYEKFNEQKFEQLTGMNGHFVQDNVSKSSYGVLRGLHLQKGDMAQAKLVSCLEGRVWDVAVDLREDSPTFGQWFGVELSAENSLQFYIPRGFAHGFLTLTDNVEFAYKADNYYNKESEGAIIYNDERIAVDWRLDELGIDEVIVSDKDEIAPRLEEVDESCFYIL